jgi:uncharacterized membrane protein
MDSQKPSSTVFRILAVWRANRKPIPHANKECEQSLSALDRLAVTITEKVGTMGFFLIILTWTVLWCGYNILAAKVPGLHWKSFDPFPAFVAYLLISNVIQILLMPLIMVGQNLQGRQSELRAEHDLEVNVKAEQEIEHELDINIKAEREAEMLLRHLEKQQVLLIHLVKAQGIKIDTMLGSRNVAAGIHPENCAVGDPR